MKIESLSEQIIPMVRQAGHLLTGRQAGQNRQAKEGTANYVTATDYAVQAYIQTELQRLTPQIPLVSEESDDHFFDPDHAAWILDPVDGTTNLMFQLQHSAVSLALWLDGRVQLAAIYNPYLDEMFSACEGGGARLNGQIIQAADPSDLRQALIGFGTTPYDRSQADITFRLLQTVFLRSFEIRRTGSAVLDLAYVACGRLSGFFELTLQPWDYAAGSLLIREAGGILSNWHNEPVSLKKPDSVLAAGPKLHAQLLDLIRQL